MFFYISLFITSISLSFIFIIFFKKLFYKIKILDNPKKYKKDRDPIPYSMGVIFCIVFFIVSYFFVLHNSKLYLIWIFGFIITSISFIDDLLNVSPKFRLLLQIIIGAIIGLTSIKIGYVSNIFGGIIDLETYFVTLYDIKVYLIPLFFTILWYVFIFNSLNWTDGIEANTSGISIISFFILFLLGIILLYRDSYDGSSENAIFIMSTSLILVGILIPFWYFDYNQKVLMGDSGTMFLGFMLATLAIISGGKIATVLVVFGIYSVDAVYVIIRRMYKRKSLFYGDFTHFHHRLKDIGLTKNQILILVYSLSTFFGLTALFLNKTGKIIIFLLIIVLVVFINKIILYFKK